MRQMRLGFTGALLLLLPATSTAAEFSVQEALLRAKPAVALVVAEVGSEVLVTCGGRGEKVVRPAPFRETGTGWFVSPSGWMITNAHVVSPAHRPPAWVADQQARRAVREACGELPPGTLATTAARARVKLDPSISVILSNGIRLTPTVSKYSPPVTGQSMSGRDLALLKLETADMPTLSLADSANAQIGDKLHVLGFPGVVLSHELLNASEGRGVGDERRDLGVQAGRDEPAGHPDRRTGRVGQQRRPCGELARRGSRCPHVRLGRRHRRGRHRPGIPLRHPGRRGTRASQGCR